MYIEVYVCIYVYSSRGHIFANKCHGNLLMLTDADKQCNFRFLLTNTLHSTFIFCFFADKHTCNFCFLLTNMQHVTFADKHTACI